LSIPRTRLPAAFYAHHGFTAFSSNPLTFVLPIATLAKKN